MNLSTGLLLAALVVFVSDSSWAQQPLFSGRGLSDGFGTTQAGNGRSGTTSIRFAKDETNKSTQPTAQGSGAKFELPKFQLPKINVPKIELPKIFNADSLPKPGSWSSRSAGLFGGARSRNSDRSTEGNFLSRVNAKTKAAFGRTREKFSSLNPGNLFGGERVANSTWDRITRGNSSDTTASAESALPPAQPKLKPSRRVNGSGNRF